MRDFDAFQLVDGPLGAVAMLPAPFYPTAQHMAIGTTDPTGPVQQNPTVSVGYIPWVSPSADDGPDSTRIDRGLVLSLTATASHVGEVNGIAPISESLFATASGAGGVHLYSADTKSGNEASLRVATEWKAAHTYPTGAAAPVLAVAARPLEQLDPDIASVGEDGRLALWRADRADPVASVVADAMTIHGVTYLSRDTVATATASGQVKLWDTRQLDRPVAVLADAPERPMALLTAQAHPTRPDRLVTGNAAGAVASWDLRNLTAVACVQAQVHKGAVHAVVHHPNSPHVVVSGGADGGVGVVSFGEDPTRPPLRNEVWRQVLASRLAVTSVALSATQDVLVAGTADGALLLKHVRFS